MILVFFIDLPVYQELLLTRTCVRYAICVLMLLYLLKNLKLLYLLVFSKYRVRHIKRILVPFHSKPYLEVEMAIRILTFICVSKFGFLVYSLVDIFLFYLFVLLFFMLFLAYMYVVGSIAKINLNAMRPFHKIHISTRVSKNKNYLKKTGTFFKTNKLHIMQKKSFHS